MVAAPCCISTKTSSLSREVFSRSMVFARLRFPAGQFRTKRVPLFLHSRLQVPRVPLLPPKGGEPRLLRSALLDRSSFSLVTRPSRGAYPLVPVCPGVVSLPLASAFGSLVAGFACSPKSALRFRQAERLLTLFVHWSSGSYPKVLPALQTVTL